MEDRPKISDATPVQIYGPPATSELVHAALDYLSISERIFSSEIPMIPAAQRFEAHDINAGGLVYQDEKVRVSAAENTHFHIPPGAATTTGRPLIHVHRLATNVIASPAHCSKAVTSYVLVTCARRERAGRQTADRRASRPPYLDYQFR